MNTCTATSSCRGRPHQLFLCGADKKSHLNLIGCLPSCLVFPRSFVIQQIPSSNLFMVVIDNTCDCSDFGPVTMDPIEIMYILNEKTVFLDNSS